MVVAHRMGLWLIAQKVRDIACPPCCAQVSGLYPVPLSFPGAVGAGEFVSPCESGDNLGEPSALEEQRGPLPLNKTLFLKLCLPPHHGHNKRQVG